MHVCPLTCWSFGESGVCVCVLPCAVCVASSLPRTMSLADELLADLDDIEDEVDEEAEEWGKEAVMEAVAEMDTKGDRSVRSFAKLLDGEKVLGNFPVWVGLSM